jgi:glutamate---cysteine ligase / carboxylate-amine ligase
MEIRFNASPRTSLGIEVEMGIVDRTTRDLTSVAGTILDRVGRDHPDGEHPKAKRELFQCTIEMITGVCTTVAEARADLDATLAELTAVADDLGVALMCSGTHPFAHWHAQDVSPSERYEDLIEKIQWPARRLAIHGIHFHVGVGSGEKAVAITSSLAYHLPLFLALSASSPYWHGLDTGLASCRTKVFEGLPTAGLPPTLDSWADFEAFMETLIAARAITSIREVWWDIRPHPDFGTVELRMSDGMASLGEVAAVAALAQCLVHHLSARLDREQPLPGARDWVVRENKWLAARYGLDASMIVDDQGALRPIRDVITDLLGTLAPAADELGCRTELDGVRRILDVGPGYARQRRIVERGGTLVDVVDRLVDELAAGEPIA